MATSQTSGPLAAQRTSVHRLHLPSAALQLFARHVNVEPTVAVMAAADGIANGGVSSEYLLKKGSTLIQSCYAMLHVRNLFRDR